MKYLALIPLLFLATALGLAADTIVLKDGTTYEGTILSEDATSYQMQVQVTASIKDVKRIPKEDVASATKSTPDDEAFKAISQILPVPDRQSVIRYDELIKGQVQPFLTAFPRSKHKAEAMEILATLQKERARAAAGDLKLDGIWINAEDRQANLFEIDARIKFGEMDSAAQAGNYKEALRIFEELKEEFSATSYYQRAVELAGKVLRTYGPIVSSDIARVDTEIANRTAELQRLSQAQRQAALAEIEREDADYLALVEREKSELKTRWLTLDPYHKAPMQVVERNITSALRDIERIDFSEHTDLGPVFREAWAAVSAAKNEEAVELIKELKSKRIPARYTEGLEKILADAEAARIAAEEQAKEEAEAARMAAAKEAEEKMAAEKAAREAAATTDKEGSGTEGGASADAPPAATESGEAPGGSNIKMILVVVMVLVLLVALGAMLLGKKKDRA